MSTDLGKHFKILFSYLYFTYICIHWCCQIVRFTRKLHLSLPFVVHLKLSCTTISSSFYHIWRNFFSRFFFVFSLFQTFCQNKLHACGSKVKTACFWSEWEKSSENCFILRAHVWSLGASGTPQLTLMLLRVELVLPRHVSLYYYLTG